MSTHFPGARLDHVFWEETSGPAVSDSSSGESPAPTEERVGWAALQRQMSPIPATAGLLQGWPEQLALSAGNGSSEVEVVPFQQVWGRSYCRALEKLVDVLSEYPDEVEHMFNPSCVSLLRCSGCCGDENLHCMPVETANVTMQSHKAQRKNLRFRGVISLAQRVEEPRSHRGLSDSRAGPPSCTIAVLAALGEEGHTGARPVCPPLRAE
eukprot:XP_022277933.1 placenta growth factor isoform X9 [Canis lupus familiaris]